MAKGQWGGKRPGAGRPRQEKSLSRDWYLIQIRVPPDIYEQLQHFNKQELILSLLQDYFAKWDGEPQPARRIGKERLGVTKLVQIRVPPDMHVKLRNFNRQELILGLLREYFA